ncbi:MAG TPA: response regulator, partial [Thermopetrobacter sp.]|nr:response regulator [Thermopetrobacter sp.]
RLNHELARAKARAEQANLDKTRFIAAASHDILQPLNAARLFTSSLVERTTTKPEGRLARQVDAALESVEEILSALLEISRIDAGAMKPEITAFPVMDVLAPLAREFAAPAAEKGLRLRVVPSSLWVRSDRRLLRRLLQNLLSNAIKYTHEGGVLMGCRRQGGQLRVIVMDTGPGIPQDKRAAVFNEFTRLPEHEGAPGLGLGLSIVERITRMLGDTIDLESRPGHGTMFTLRVPLARAGARPSRRAEARPAPPPEAGAAKVLVIDDDATILQGMKTLLGGWGHEVVTAHDAATAQAHMSAGRRFTAIIADYHLGGNIDGISLIRALRGAAGGELPAILITANSGPGLRKRASRERIILLNKPVRPAALRATLNRACQISRPPKRAAAE